MNLWRAKEWLNFPNPKPKRISINKLLAKIASAKKTRCVAANYDANSIVEQYWARISSAESQHFLIEFCLHNGKQLW